jgi:hypothetical protein
MVIKWKEEEKENKEMEMMKGIEKKAEKIKVKMEKDKKVEKKMLTKWKQEKKENQEIGRKIF